MTKVFANSKQRWQDFLNNGNTSCCKVSKGDNKYLAAWNGLTNTCYILDDDFQEVDQLVLEPDWDEEEGQYCERHFCERCFPEFGYTVVNSRKQWVRELYNLDKVL